MMLKYLNKRLVISLTETNTVKYWIALETDSEF